ncbi:MAG: diguanylate cyclase [Clostridia bacterium]|nr:diguanylate cyclase [Clostridia bacterium]
MEGRKKARLTFALLIDWVMGWEDTIYYQNKILSGVESFARENDINLLCFVCGRLDPYLEWERKRNILMYLIDKKYIDGLIILAASIGLDPENSTTMEILKRCKGIPVVTLNKKLMDFPCVSVDNVIGMRQIMDHMIEEHQCREIAFIKGPESNVEARARFEAYVEALKKHNIPYNSDLVYNNQSNFDFSAGVDAMKLFLDEKKVRFDAIVAANDNMAVGALTELYTRTGKVPENLPVTGFDDSELGKSYSLTTVRQPFYEMSKAVAGVLLKLIQGHEVDSNLVIPTEMVVRSSCGCILKSILDASMVRYDLSKRNSKEIFQDHREQLLCELSKLNQCVDPHDSRELFNHERKLMDALDEVVDSGDQKKFFAVLNNLLFWMITRKIDLFILQEVLSLLRKNTLSCLCDLKAIADTEAMFHAARIQIVEVIQSAGVSHKIIAYFQAEGVGILGEELVSNLDFMSQMDILARELPHYGIKGCYVSLYEDPLKPMEYSRLVLGFNANKRIMIDSDGIRYRSQDLLPENAMKELEETRYSAIVQALYQGDDQLGFAVFDYGSEIGKSFETIRYRLSFALKGTLLIDKITKQAQDLERQVAERTKELSDTNQKLEDEIHFRKDVEIQLKKALEELEVYNRQLHYQSYMDELTGLYNRRGFMSLGLQHYQYAVSANKGFWVIFGDLDGLKQINDLYGHKEGDYAIKKAGEILKSSFRNLDIVARLGGDEFTVIVVDSAFQDEKALLNRIRGCFEEYNGRAHKPYQLSMSIGAYYFKPETAVTFEELLNRADSELYKQKHRSRK